MKTSVFHAFFKKVTMLSTLLFIIAILMNFYLPARFVTPTLPYQVLFFYAISLSLFYILSRSIQERFNQFLNYFILATGIKLILLLLIIILYVFNYKEDAFAFIVSFFILYVLYSVVEVVSLLQFNRSLKN
ncbi:MAG: hypothetical protein WCH34_12960 [Bacteroidota bacterium]